MEEEVKNEESQEGEKEEEDTSKAQEKEPEKKAVVKDTSAKPSDQEEKPLDKMTAPELKEIAKQIPGITGVTAMKKDQLLAIIKDYRGIKDEEPPKKAKKRTTQDVSVKNLKQKIVQLKTEKEAAQKAKDRKRTNILRRRINRMKKSARKVAHS
jgi:hypothetical protein